MKSVISVQAYGSQTSKGAHVHALAYDSARESMCGMLQRYKKILGAEADIMLLVDMPVNCLNCIKAMQIVLRGELEKLSWSGLTKVSDLIAGLRNGDLVA
jgi:hypothetical protein